MPYLFFSILMLFLQASYAEKWNDSSDKALVFEIVQAQYSFNNADIKEASIIQEKNTYMGLLIRLKPAAAAEFQNMTNRAIGKQANFIFNKKLVSSATIQTPLSDSFLITGISKEDALAFITMLNNQAKNVPASDDVGVQAVDSN